MRDVFLISGILAIGLLISFAAAQYGHPTSVWLWRDVLGIMP